MVPSTVIERPDGELSTVMSQVGEALRSKQVTVPELVRIYSRSLAIVGAVRVLPPTILCWR